MPSSPFHVSAAATPEASLMEWVRMEEPSFRTCPNHGRDALISTSYLSSRNSKGQAYEEGDGGGAQLPDSSAPRP
ncbi:hypothetical protein MRX96_045873 [Rhipicephalus microplus]